MGRQAARMASSASSAPHRRAAALRGPLWQMTVPAMPLLDAAGARAGDRAAVDAGDTWAGLMERAAGHLARGVVALAGRHYGLRVTIVVGSGNNGGDGWVAATRLEREHGAQVWIVSPRGLEVELSAEAAAGRARWLAHRGRTSTGTADLDQALAWCDVAVDALLGTGITGEVRGKAADATAALRRAHAEGTPVVACDVPSGVASDDGRVATEAVRADLTVTFGALKRGLLLHPGAAHAGRVVVADLGEGFRSALPVTDTGPTGPTGPAGPVGPDGHIGPDGATDPVGSAGHGGDGGGARNPVGEGYDGGSEGDGGGARNPEGEGHDVGSEGDGTAGHGGSEPDRAHATTWWVLTAGGAAPDHLDVAVEKRARGSVLAVAGGPGTSGAAALCAGAALHAGAGLVSLATPHSLRAEVAARTDAGVMVRGIAEELSDTGHDGSGAIAADALADDALVETVDVVVAGPGIGVGSGARDAVADLRRRARRLVLDADAINVHRDDPSALADHAGALVLTPHERELARIGGGDDGPDAWARRVQRVPELAREFDATIVAKGPGTLVAAPDGRVWVTPVGGPALGSGGTGDVLAGVIAAAIARADDVPLAVARAVWWHAAAGELGGVDRAGRATATDLLRTLPEVLGALADGRIGALLGDALRGEELPGVGARPGDAPRGVLPGRPWSGEVLPRGAQIGASR